MTEFLRRSGHRVIPAIKGKDSVNASIDLLKRYKLYVKGDNAIREFRNYKWKKDRQGRITNIPEHDFSHSIDASRYIAFAMLGKPNFGRYAIR
jgi:phage terminase large subunit